MSGLVHAISLQYAGHDTAMRPTATKTAAYTAVMGDLVICDTSGGAITIALPDVSDGQRGVVAVRLAAGTAVVTVDPYSSQTIDGAATGQVAVPGETREYVADGSGHWFTAAGGGTLLGLRQVAETLTVNTVAASGAAQTIPEPSVYGLNDITLSADCTFTFPAATVGKRLRIVVRQNGTGNWDITWPAGTKTAPAALQPTQTAGAIDYFSAVSVVEDEWLVYREGAVFA